MASSVLNAKFLVFSTPNTKNSAASNVSNLKKIGMELQCCSKNEMVQTNVLKILFNFYSTLSSPLTLSLLSRGGSLVEVNGRSLWAIGNSLWVVNKWFNLLGFGWFQGSVVVLVFEACGL